MYGLFRRSRTYTDERLEDACELAIHKGIKPPRYHHLKAILSANEKVRHDVVIDILRHNALFSLVMICGIATCSGQILFDI